jgi:hypothetical protein
LARDGLSKSSAPDLIELGKQCREHADRAGDLRFRIVGDALQALGWEWEDRGAIQNESGLEVEEAMRGLPGILDSPSMEVGAQLAVEFADALKAPLARRWP